MTEKEWWKCPRPEALLAFLGSRVTQRKRATLLVACCLTYQEKELTELRPALTAADQLIERTMSWEEIGWWTEETNRLKESWVAEQDFEKAVIARMAHYIFEEPGVTFPAYLQCHNEEPWPNYKAESDRISCCLIRELWNPFVSPMVDPSWLTSDVTALSTGIYQDRAFDRMPILSDALQDAGCDKADFLDHCRSEGPHVRGCWVVDMLLGKS